MNDSDRVRLDAFEARLETVDTKVDRVLVLLDDPDFGLRYRMKANTDGLQSVKNQLYGLMSGFVVMLVGSIIAIVK